MNEKLIKEIAEYCTETGLNNTLSGNYIIEFADIAECFDIDVELVRENAEEISCHIEHLLDIDIYEDEFNMMFEGHACCERCSTYQDGNRCAEECEGCCDVWCEDMDEDYEYPTAEEFDKSERENLKIGDLAYCSKTEMLDIIVDKIERSEGYESLYSFKRYGGYYQEEFIRKPTEDELKWYNVELDAKKWLKNRQEELKTLTFRRFDSDLWKEEKELLKEAGYFVYDLRDWDDGKGYNIEHHVCVNHIGCWITDIDLTPYMNEGYWIGIDELKYANIKEIPYLELKEYFDKGNALHFKDK